MRVGDLDKGDSFVSPKGIKGTVRQQRKTHTLIDFPKQTIKGWKYPVYEGYKMSKNREVNLTSQGKISLEVLHTPER